jgi:hypothetical protein
VATDPEHPDRGDPMKNLLSSTVTIFKVFFWVWQAASVLILLYNFDMVVEMYTNSLSMTQEFWQK